MSWFRRTASLMESWLDRFDARGGVHLWRTAVWVGILGWALSIFLYLQPIQFTPEYRPRWKEFSAQCENPLDRDVVRPMLQYRIATPVIAWALGLRGWWTVSIQYAALYVNLVLVYVAMARRTRPSTAVLTTLALSLTFVTQWVNSFPGYPDSVSHAAASACLFNLNPLASAFMVILGTMNDERFLTAAPFLLLWWVGAAGPRRHGGVAKLCVGGMLGLAVVVSLRLLLKRGVIGPGIVVPYTYADIWHNSILRLRPYDSTWPKFLFSVLMGFRWFWWMPLAAMFGRGGRMTPSFRALYLAPLAAAMLSCAIVLDVSRSVSFFFPALLVSVAVVHDADAAYCRRALMLILVLQVITPTCTFIGQGPFCLWPPLYQALRWWMGRV